MPQSTLRISSLLQRTHGIDVTHYAKTFLLGALRRRMEELSCPSLEAYGEVLAASRDEALKLSKQLTVHHSEFTRNALTFAVLERIVIPALLLRRKTSGKKELRVWSAACAAGQEAYSMAMLLEEHRETDQRALRRQP